MPGRMASQGQAWPRFGGPEVGLQVAETSPRSCLGALASARMAVSLAVSNSNSFGRTIPNPTQVVSSCALLVPRVVTSL
jgi:hypothetical protein